MQHTCVVISGWYGHNNLGDEAILDVITAELGQRLGPCEFAILSEAASVPSATTWRQNVLRWLPHPSPFRPDNLCSPRLWTAIVGSWTAVSRSDLFVLGGGGLLRDNFRRSNLLRLLDDVLVARLAGVPVAMLALGAGPFVTRFGTAIIRSAVGMAQSVTVRDQASKAALHAAGAPTHRVRVEADPALLLPDADPPFLLPRGNGPNIAICPSQGMLTGFSGGARGNPRLVELLAETALRLVQSAGARAWLVPFCRSSAGDDDVILCERIRTAAGQHDSVQAAPWIADPRQAKGLLRRMDLVIGARLHALIFGIGAGVPCLAINYEPKVAGFMAEVGLAEYSMDPIAFAPARAVEMAKRLSAEWPVRSAEVEARVRSAQLRVRSALNRAGDLALMHRRRRCPIERRHPRRDTPSPIPSSPADSPDSVSVIIPAYNAERFIADAIDSAIQQTHPPLEILVVDDGSTDGTVDVVRRYGERIRLLQQANRGPAAARNLGLAHARGAYVAFLDADDIWTLRNLELQTASLDGQPGCVLAYGRIRQFVGEPADELRQSDPAPDAWPEGDVEEALIHDTIWATCAVVARRRVLSQLGGFDEGLRVGEDYDLWLRCAAIGSVRYNPYYVAACRQHAASTTRTSPYRTVPPPVHVIRRHLQRRPFLRRRLGASVIRRRLARWYFESARHSLDTNQLAPSLLHFAIAACMAPWNGRAFLAYARTFARSVLLFTIGLRPGVQRGAHPQPALSAQEARR